MADFPRFDGDDYTTVVIHHPDVESAHALSCEMLERFPMFVESGARVTMIGYGDKASVADAAQMVLECQGLEPGDRLDLALEILELSTWPACLAKFAEWDLSVQDGELVDTQVAA